jgi:hypothetical protein
MIPMKRILSTALALAILGSISVQAAPHGGSSRPNYGGGKHTSSHGGSYSNGQGSSHKGGHYNAPNGSHNYGKHK